MLTRFSFSTSIVLALAISVIAQNNTGAKRTMPLPESAVDQRKQVNAQNDIEPTLLYDQLYKRRNYARVSNVNAKWRARMIKLYRVPKDSELGNLTPKSKFLKRYGTLLRSKKAGIFVLRPEQGCPANAESVSLAKECAPVGIPGSGSSYSFRLRSYRIRRLADITYDKRGFVTSDQFSNAVYVALGNVPLERVTNDSPGLQFLISINAPRDSKQAVEHAKRFKGGVNNDGFVYGRGAIVKENFTFAMRSIAYRGKILRSELGVPYDELNFDKRRDVVVAFRIVDVADDGAATIVWKILRSEKSPKMKIAKK